MRLAAQQCLPPIVKLITSVGAVHIEGSSLEFAAEDVNPFFLEAGFLTQDAGPERRRLSAASLMGFFNSVDQLRSTQNSSRPSCLPDLPEQPRALRSRSKEHVLCQDCYDPEGFVIPNLAGVETVNGRPFYMFEESSALNTVQLGNLNVTQTKSVRRYPRFPQLYVFDVFNGTHDLKWVEYEGTKFRCHTSLARTNSSRGEVTEAAAAPLLPAIRYEGFTYFSGERYSNVPSLMYTMSWPELRLRQEYFATAHNVNSPLGLRMYDYNEHVQQYELSHRVDFWDVAVDDEITLPAETFSIPNLGDCIPDEGTISIPPNPADEYIGVGFVTSEQAAASWGEVLPPSYYDTAVNTSIHGSDGWGDLPPPPNPSPPPPTNQPLPPPPPPPSPSPPSVCVDEQTTGYTVGSTPASCSQLAQFCTHVTHGDGVRSVCPVTCGACPICTNACSHAFDNDCDDGGTGSEYSVCTEGSDCQDCQFRYLPSGRRLSEHSQVIANHTPATKHLEKTSHGRELSVGNHFQVTSTENCIDGALGHSVRLPSDSATIQLVKDFCIGEIRVEGSGGNVPLTPLRIVGSAGVNYHQQAAFGALTLSVGCISVLQMMFVPKWVCNKLCNMLNLGDNWLYGIGAARSLRNLWSTCQTDGNSEGNRFQPNGRALGISFALGAQLEICIPGTWLTPSYCLAKAAAEVKFKIRRTPLPLFGSGTLCLNNCHYPSDGYCDDGGAGSEYSVCALGSDCVDCGPRGGDNAPAKFFLQVNAEGTIMLKLYNLGREKKFEKRLYPSREPTRNSRSCRGSLYYIKDHANADAELYKMFGAW